MKVRYSRRATKDLEAIHDYLTKRSPQGAINVLTSIYATVEFIRRHSEAAQTTNISGVRAMVVRRYHFKVFYALSKRRTQLRSCTYAIHRAVCGQAKTTEAF